MLSQILEFKLSYVDVCEVVQSVLLSVFFTLVFGTFTKVQNTANT